MSFASGLRESLQIREIQVPLEFTRGDSLETILSRHLLAVEQMAEREVITSILLLSRDGKRLSHGAGPNLPQSYRVAIDGAEIGPCAGSCGTAAFFGRPVYVNDIASDPLWADYRHVALPHGLRSCWSTPIRDNAGSVIATFAIYHRTVGSPSREEIEAIEMITEHVAHAIMWAEGIQELDAPAKRTRKRPRLELVDNDSSGNGIRHPDRLALQLQRLEALAADLDSRADNAESKETGQLMREVAADGRRLISIIRHRTVKNPPPKS